MFDPLKFSVAAPKSVPVLFLLDVSSSMSGMCGSGEVIQAQIVDAQVIDDDWDDWDDARQRRPQIGYNQQNQPYRQNLYGQNRNYGSISKIQALNNALNASLEGFKKAQTLETFIKLALISFGPGAKLEQNLTPVNDINQTFHLKANGNTPLGAALKMAKAMIEDKEIFLGSDYRPAVVLLSDGMPNDDWEGPLEDFIKTGRSAKCDRFAIAFGQDADKDMLRRFIAGCDNDLFEANDAENLYKVFKKITMSVSQRVSSQNKNASIKISLEDDPTSF